jgi:hypothetical protein
MRMRAAGSNQIDGDSPENDESVYAFQPERIDAN